MAVAHLSLVEFALFILLGWRGAYYLNRLIDAPAGSRPRGHRKESQSSVPGLLETVQ